MSSRMSHPSSRRSRRSSRGDEDYDDEDYDPNDRHYQDDDEDASDMGDTYTEGPRFKYSTADLADDSKRNTTCCMVSLCVVCVVIAIIISVIVANIIQNSYDDDEVSPSDSAGSSGPPGSKPRPGIDLFKTSKEEVDRLCSVTELSINKDGCQELCADFFDCCDPFSDEDTNCFHGNRQGCLNYARCHVMNLRFDPPPDNLWEICSMEALEKDRSECEASCLTSQCCWSDTISCATSDFYACVDYAPCQNLRDVVQVPVPDSSIFDLCHPDVSGSVIQGRKCNEICELGECCARETVNFKDCLEDNFFSCMSYNLCNFDISIPPANNDGLIPPVVEIEEACSFRAIQQNGTEDCEAQCGFGACCSAKTTDNCFEADPLGCLEYDACKVLD